MSNIEITLSNYDRLLEYYYKYCSKVRPRTQDIIGVLTSVLNAIVGFDKFKSDRNCNLYDGSSKIITQKDYLFNHNIYNMIFELIEKNEEEVLLTKLEIILK